MPIDKSWIDKPRNTPEYANGLKKFLDFAFQHQSIRGREIKCPCPKCGCSKWQTRDIVQEHLTCKPFPKNYKVWYWHGENSNVVKLKALENTRHSRNENIRNVPKGINEEQLALFVDYRLKPSTKELCKRNQVIRSKQTIPHTTGAKSLARRRAELIDETREADRGELWKLTHKKKDGNYINDEAREIVEKIDDHMSQDSENGFEISPTNAVGEVSGKEHPGRVRGLGMGVVPTVAFKRTTTRIGGMNMGSCGASTSSQEVKQRLVTMESQIQALCAYIVMKEGGRMPEELATLFPNFTSQAPDIGSGSESPNDIRSSDGSNNNSVTNHLSPHT